MVQLNEENKVKLNFSDLITWTDEKCEEFDTKSFIPSKAVRDILLQNVKLVKERDDYKQFQQVVSEGLMLGYVITCPKCHVQYKIAPTDLNFNKEITCQDCGETYIQNKNIFGIFIRQEGVENAAQE